MPYSSHLSHKFALIKWRKQEHSFSSHEIGGQKGAWPQPCLPVTQAPVLKGIQHSPSPHSPPACGTGCQGAGVGRQGVGEPCGFPFLLTPHSRTFHPHHHQVPFNPPHLRPKRFQLTFLPPALAPPSMLCRLPHRPGWTTGGRKRRNRSLGKQHRAVNFFFCPRVGKH